VQPRADQQAAPADQARLPDPAEPIPALAWPTVALFAAAVSIFAAATVLALAGSIPLAVAIVLNTVASYMFFTVLHDASHRSLSRRDGVNTWLGRLSAPFVTPGSSYSVFRYIHMQHHRFTNGDPGKDPDAYACGGPAWSWPARWATLDLAYLAFYAPRLGSRPRREQLEYLATLTIVVAAYVGFALVAGLGALLLLIVLPTRLNITFLGFAFDWLPHHGLDATPDRDRFKTTRNRVGLEWLMTPALIYQNYHLVHHLHPLIPFYRYLVAWRRNEEAYLAQRPPLRTVTGRDLDPGEYRRRRGLPH
jgi:ring-1,2-phenylacetyl-CoA epoxidase subunit PaaE